MSAAIAVPDVTAPARDLDLQVVPCLSQEGLALIYLRAQAQGLLKWFWHNKIPPLSEVLATYDPNNPQTIAYGCVWTRNGEPQMVGLGEGHGMTEMADGTRRIEVGMLFLKEIHNTDLPLEFAALMLDDAFPRLNLNAAYGITPVLNRAAVRFIHRTGFEKLAVLPNYVNFRGRPCDAVMSVMTRERWETGIMHNYQDRKAA